CNFGSGNNDCAPASTSNFMIRGLLASNRGHDASPCPFGSPFLTKLTQYAEDHARQALMSHPDAVGIRRGRIKMLEAIGHRALGFVYEVGEGPPRRRCRKLP